MSAAITFIDASIQNYQTLIDQFSPNTECIVLTSESDGLTQIAQALAGRSNIEAIHIVSHGSEGSLSLGTSTLNSDNFSEYSAILASIGQHLSATGDILLYGCNVAAGQIGEQFVASLAQYTGADVAASDDLTGAAGLGGDWQLEVANGDINTQALTANNWQGALGVNTTLANYDLNLMADLAGLAKAAYFSGTNLTTAVNNLGWQNVDQKSAANSQVFYADRVVDGNKEMVISFRGTEPASTETPADIITDISTYGFTNYYKNVRTYVEDWLVKAYLGNYDKVYLTGHSLGGAAAQIALLDILEDNNSSIWTKLDGSSLSGSPLQTGDRFMDTRRSHLRAAVKAYVQDHVQGATFGAPSISIDAPNTAWYAGFSEDGQLNPVFDLAKYKNLLFQFEHKVGTGNTFVDDVITFVKNLNDDFLLGKAKYFGILAETATVISTAIIQQVIYKWVNESIPRDERSDDFVAALNSGNTTRGNELGTLQAIDLANAIYDRYSALSGGSTSFLMLHSMDYYVESLLRATTNNALITATPSRVEFANNYPTLSSTTASTGNDLIQVGTTSSSGNGNDILVASTNTNKLTGGLGNDAFVIKGSGADVTLVGSKERKDHLYFNMEGTITAQENGEALEITMSGPSGSRKVTIANWYAGGGNAYQLYEIAQITPVTVISQAALTQNNSYYNQTDLANRNLTALGIAFLNEGGSLSDRILGSFSNDTMHGYAGDDNMSGRDGNDIIYGDAGNDYIEGGAGNDTIVDNEGYNTISGGTGDDVITASHAVVDGGDGIDVLTANMSGSSNYGSSYNSGYRDNGLQYSSAAGGATVGFNSGFESVEAFLSDVAGRIDVYNGGLDALNQQYQLASWQSIEKISVTGTSQTGEYEGNDLLMVIGSGGTYIGGSAANYDTLYADWNTATAVIDWDSSRTAVQTLNGVQVQGIERVLFRLGSGNDIIKNTNTTSDQIYAGAGNDTISLGAGVNFVDGGDGNDTITGSRGNYNGGDGTDVLTANMGGVSNYGSSYNSGYRENGLQYGSADGGSTVGFNSGFESVEAFLSDVVGRIDVYNSGLDALNQQYQLASWQSIEKISVTGTSQTGEYEGNDLLMVIGSGGTYIGGSAANYDTLYADWNTATAVIDWDSSRTSVQTLNGVQVQGIERVLFRLGSGNDIIKNTNTTSDQIYAGAGNDTISLGAGVNFVDGGDGNDTITGSRGNYNGGDGADVLTANMSGSSNYGSSYNYQYRDNGLQYGSAAGGSAVGFNSGFESVEAFLSDVAGRIDVYNSGLDALNQQYQLASWQSIEKISVTGTSQTGEYEGNDLLMVIGTGGTYIGGSAANYDTLYADWNTATAAISWDNNTGGTTSQVINGVTIRGIERLLLRTGSADDIIRNVNYAAGDQIFSGAGNDQLYTGAGTDLLKGEAGNDTLDGGAGADRLEGGTGNDVYYVDNAGDVVVELDNNGTDKVNASISYILAVNIEELVLTATADINGTGNSLNNNITGNTGNNVLDGGTGTDTLKGGLGNDTYYVDSIGDLVVENVGEGTDLVQSSISYSAVGINIENITLLGTTAINATGNDLNNTLTGNSANNILNGGTGIDTMTGGVGDDVYIVDNEGDVVVEALNQGTDTVQSAISYTLVANVENLQLTGTGAINAVGNGLNNLLTGNTGINTLTGGLGNDTYVINNSTDVVIENASEGIDTVQSSVTYTLSANIENLTLTGITNVNGTGNDSNNILTANNGNNILNGSIGSDTLIGGIGNDTYIIDSSADIITENLAEGTDTAQASSSYTLSANIENLTLLGSTSINGTGNNLNNILTGNAANNTLTGAEGNDILNGGAGADTLIGGLDNDTYIVDNVADVISETSTLVSEIDTVQSSATFTLSANVEVLTLTGTAAINGTGNNLANTITGNGGNNRLDGGLGADSLLGGIGNDTYVVDNLGDVITESTTLITEIDIVESSISYSLGANLESLTLTGTSAINSTGNSLANTLIGNSANNMLDGGSGADTHIGGLGNDTYIVGNVADVITELANEGIDTVSTVVSHTLGANLENLILTGTSAINGTGNSLANTITGNSGNNRLNGGVGVDSLLGGVGNDTYVVDNLGDVITESSTLSTETDTVESSLSYSLGTNLESLILTGASAISGTGNSAANTITGNSGNNRLNGGVGADSLLGGLGNDSYVVDNLGDVVTESSTLSTEVDNVESSISYSLGANLEKLLLTGTSAINGTGNSLANTLTGNSSNNRLNGGVGVDTLIGGAGNDTYVVDNIGDVITESSTLSTEIDTVESSISYTLGSTTLEKLTLTGALAINGTGNSLANTLIGNSANNILDGGAGADIHIGGLGNDTYIVGNVADVITELANEGIDTVSTAVSHTLGANLENLILTGTTAVNGTGNSLANILTGNGGANTLNGGVGSDTLIGGLGNDSYLFSAGGGVDTILDNDSTVANTDILSFMGSIAFDQLWFSHVGANLEVSVIGTTDKVIVQDWYVSSSRHIEQIKVSSNKTLLNNEVESLVTAMAALTPPPLGQTTLTTQQHSQLDAVLAANWS